MLKLGVILSILVPEVRKKINNIRPYFSQEYPKVTGKKSGASASDVYVSKWQYYTSLKFLEPYLICRRTISNVVSSFNIPLPGNLTLTLKIPAHVVPDNPCSWGPVVGTLCYTSKHTNRVFLPLTI